MRTKYFRFYDNSNKKLSKEDLTAIVTSEVKNGTIDSDLVQDELFWFDYLTKHNIDIKFDALAEYKQESDNVYIGRFVYQKGLFEARKNIVERACRIKIFDKFNEEDIRKIRSVFPLSPRDDKEILDYYVELYTFRCSDFFVLDENSTLEQYFESTFEGFLMDLRTYEERQVMLSYKTKFYNFFEDEFSDCFNKVSKYSYDVNLRVKYDKL